MYWWCYMHTFPPVGGKLSCAMRLIMLLHWASLNSKFSLWARSNSSLGYKLGVGIAEYLKKIRYESEAPVRLTQSAYFAPKRDSKVSTTCFCSVELCIADKSIDSLNAILIRIHSLLKTPELCKLESSHYNKVTMEIKHSLCSGTLWDCDERWAFKVDFRDY